MTKEKARELINTYGEAWVKQDPELILTVFTPDATYDDPNEPKNFGYGGIRAYWISKVLGEQKDINFKLQNVWIDEGGEKVIAEWEAEFTDVVRNLRIHMFEVAIFDALGDKFSSLRKYYKTTKTAL